MNPLRIVEPSAQGGGLSHGSGQSNNGTLGCKPAGGRSHQSQSRVVCLVNRLVEIAHHTERQAHQTPWATGIPFHHLGTGTADIDHAAGTGIRRQRHTGARKGKRGLLLAGRDRERAPQLPPEHILNGAVVRGLAHRGGADRHDGRGSRHDDALGVVGKTGVEARERVSTHRSIGEGPTAQAGHRAHALPHRAVGGHALKQQQTDRIGADVQDGGPHGHRPRNLASARMPASHPRGPRRSANATDA